MSLGVTPKWPSSAEYWDHQAYIQAEGKKLPCPYILFEEGDAINGFPLYKCPKVKRTYTTLWSQLEGQACGCNGRKIYRNKNNNHKKAIIYLYRIKINNQKYGIWTFFFSL